MTLSWETGLPALLVAAAGSFVFALAESALFSLGLWRTRHLPERFPGRGDAVVRVLEQPNELLATLVLGNALANSFLMAIGLLLALPAGVPLSVAAAVLIGGIVLVCEVTPKALAVRDPEFWALRVARPISWLMWLVRPLRRVSHWIVEGLLARVTPRALRPTAGSSEEEYRDLVEMAVQQGALGSREKELILQILSLDRRQVREVMRPRAEMLALPDDLPMAQMVAAARESGHHRIPLYDATPDTIVGVLNTRTLLLAPEPDLSEAIEFPSFVPETMNLLKLFESMQRQQRGMAIVLDEFGGMSGMVTLQDILESVVGRIRGEGEAEGFVMRRVAPGRWHLSGTMRLDDFRRECPQLDDDPDVDTVGGLVVKLAEVVPGPGEVFQHRRVRFRVRAADERRVREVEVELADGTGGVG